MIQATAVDQSHLSQQDASVAGVSSAVASATLNSEGSL